MKKRPSELRTLAAEMAALVENNPDFLEIVDFAAGALLCLIYADDYNFRERPGPLPAGYAENVVKRLIGMSKGKKPGNRFWISGWHFNSALVRIASAYHNALKLFAGDKNKHVKELLLLLETFLHQKLGEVHKEVNFIKHDIKTVAAGRTVSFEDAIEALRKLVNALASPPRPKKTSSPH
jgi:hypothetical protein